MIPGILIFIFSLVGGVPSAVEPAPMKSIACDFFGPENAAKLLGKNFRGEKGGMTRNADGRSWACTFVPSDDTGRTGPKVHILLLKNETEEGAIRAFDSIRLSNKKHHGYAEWPEIADEAMIQSDAPNFYFLMVRKGAKSLRIKVNPAEGVSLDDLKSIAASLAAKL